MLCLILKTFLQIGAASLALFAAFKPKLALILIKTFPRDLRGLKRAAHSIIQLKLAMAFNLTVGKQFDLIAKKHPHKVCIYFGDEKWTFEQIEKLSNQVGNYFQQQGFKHGDSLGLLMENRAEYIAIWLGLSKIGVVPALINFNLRLESLQHTLNAAKCKAIIYGSELSQALSELYDIGYSKNIPTYGYDQEGGLLKNSTDLIKDLKSVSIKHPKPDKPVLATDSLFYVFTSGTTGLPKAAFIKHFRFFMAAYGAHNMNGIKREDVMYSPLPLYHSAAGMLAAGQALVYGTSIVLKKKFSASVYWKDCINYNVTVIQYIGEICRYLYSQPETPEEKLHKVRMMFGNGLRISLWKDFTDRFNIPLVAEFYGSTEGNCNVTNIDGHIGAVGFIPRLIYPILPMKIIKMDEITGEPLRDPKTGLAIKCSPNEEGELVGIIKKDHPIRDFKGYADESSTQKKILYDVFSKGDMVFRSGDLLVMDEYGYIYFKDRTGDTYRWKGENVSTAEVEAVISKVCGLKDAVVYGVQIPGTEGRAGMAAVVDKENSLNIKMLAEGIVKNLPAYSRPIFLRTVSSIDLTSTYKMKKFELQKEGFDVGKIDDKVYYFDGSKFIQLTSELHEKILNGKIRL